MKNNTNSYTNCCALLIMLLLSFTANSESSGVGRVIDHVGVEHGHVFITTDPALSFSSCDNSSEATVKIELNSTGHEQLYAATLAAFMSGKKVTIWTQGCTSSPWGRQIPKVYAVQLRHN